MGLGYHRTPQMLQVQDMVALMWVVNIIIPGKNVIYENRLY